MQLSKTSKILLITLLAIILIGSIFLVIQKQTNDTEKPITEVEGQAENQDQAIEPDTQDQVETDNQIDQDNANEEQDNDNPEQNQTAETDTQTNQEVIQLDTSTWKTYTNEEYGFSFKYPGEWYVKQYEGENSIYINDIPFPDKEESLPPTPIFIMTFSVNQDDLVTRYKDMPPSLDLKYEGDMQFDKNLTKMYSAYSSYFNKRFPIYMFNELVDGIFLTASISTDDQSKNNAIENILATTHPY